MTRPDPPTVPPSAPGPEETTQILAAIVKGDPAAANRLLPLVYARLRELAAKYLGSEAQKSTLQPTALVHEAYLRMLGQSRVDWKSRAHFLGVAAQMIRRVLVDHTRERRAAKRGGQLERVALSDTIVWFDRDELDLLALDEALEELGRLNERHRRAVELRFFGGLSVDETAHVLGVSPQTVKLDWRVARAWLRERLGD